MILPASAAAQSPSEAGRPWIETYTADTYGTWSGSVKRDHQHVRATTQGPNGRIYLATQDGVLIYDGSRWSDLPVHAGTIKDSVSVHATARSSAAQREVGVFSIGRLPPGHVDAGRILVGADGSFGTLRKDSLGVLSYRSLLHHLSERDRQQVGPVTLVQATRHAAYFLTSRALYRWTGASVTAWSLSDLPPRASSESQPEDTNQDVGTQSKPNAFSALFSVRDTLYVHVTGVGLFHVENESLAPVSSARPFADANLQMMVPSGHSADAPLLVGTAQGAFFELSKDGGVDALDWDIEPWLERRELSHGVRLPDGTIALATRQGGVARISAAGDRLHVLDARVGLPSDVANHVFLDRGAGLWIALGDGLARIDVLAPFTYFDEPLGLSTGVDAIERHNGTLYACSRSGLHRLETPDGTFARMASVPGLHAPCTSLASTTSGLLVGTDRGVVVHRTDQPSYVAMQRDVATGTTSPLLHPADTIAFVAGDPSGLYALRRENGRWSASPDTPLSPELDTASIRHLAWDDTGTIWAATDTQVLRVQNPRSDEVDIARFDDANGLPVTSDMRVFTVSDTVYVSTKNGLYRHLGAASSEASAAFAPATTFDPDWANEGAQVTHLIETDNGGVWGRAIESSGDGQQVVTSLYRGPQGRLHNSRPFVPFRDRVRGPFYVEDQVVWIGDRGASPLSRLDFSGILAASNASEGPAAHASGGNTRNAPLIRHVSTVSPASTLYGEAASGQTIRVPHHRSGLNIQFAYPSFALVASPVEFRTRLSDTRSWTSWSRQASATYSNLPAGRHHFEVQARLPGEAPSAITTLTLHVVPAWYRTPGALTLWGLLGLAVLGGLVYGGVRWRTNVLQRRQTQLQTTVRERTHQVEQKNQQLADQASRLRHMDRVKSEFFANVSHEFRTPLTLIIGPLEDLLKDEDSSLSRIAQQNVAFALRNSHRLLRLIGQLLDTAKLETGKLTLRMQVLDLNAFVHGLVQVFTPLAERNRVQVHLDRSDDPILINADPDKLEKMIGNLLSNALKFTPSDEQVHVSLASDTQTDEAVVTVEDSGPGISPEDVPNIFDRFYQANAAVPAQPGTGIGLSLAKDLTELHGGSITAENGSTRGAIFTIRLPLHPAAPESHPFTPQEVPTPYEDAGPRTSEPPSGAEHRSGGDGEPVEASSWMRMPAAPLDDIEEQASLGEGEEARTTLLVADDNDEVRAYVRSHFASTYRIIEARNGREAIRLAQNHLPDLIISDVMMPEVNGFDVVRTLRSKPATDFLPVILLTARAEEEDRVAGLDEGTDAYLTKPFSIRELRSRVENLLASRRRLKKRFASAPDIPEPAASDDPTDIDALSDLSPDGRVYVERARNIVLDHLEDEEFGVEELADALSQSRSTVYRRLRDHVGLSPTVFIRETRLRKGAKLLRNGEGTVSEIAYAVGFKSVSYFSKSFGDLYGVVPSAYAETVSES